MIVTKQALRDEFERLMRRTFELSTPELAALVARRFSLPVETVLDVLSEDKEPA